MAFLLVCYLGVAELSIFSGWDILWTLRLVGVIYPLWYYYIRRRSFMLTESSLFIFQQYAYKILTSFVVKLKLYNFTDRRIILICIKV